MIVAIGKEPHKHTHTFGRTQKGIEPGPHLMNPIQVRW